ncbi:unnamed protein product [Lactuca virosa]|uniref:Uncharacterized protein n=1 Tax=Lactuca virosa TaxID=75947 RepID=A0AAU9N8M4_9ASTR|nr:unnamed protein product [Lactuca virosa]
MAVVWGNHMCYRPICIATIRLWSGSNPILGDAHVIAGTYFFAVSNVGEDLCVKKVGRVEVITMLGLYGIILFERKDLRSICLWPQIILSFPWYGKVAFIFCTLIPLVLRVLEPRSSVFSLLTTNIWAVVIHVFLHHQKVDCLYYMSLLLVDLGLCINSNADKDSNELTKVECDDLDQSCLLLPMGAYLV